MTSVVQRLSSESEKAWIRIGKMAKTMGDEEKTLFAYDNVLKHNMFNAFALKEIAVMHMKKGNYEKAIDYFHRTLNVDNVGKTWCNLGLCLMKVDRLDKAYIAFHHAISKLKVGQDDYDCDVWYGLGCIYDEFRQLNHAEKCYKYILNSFPNFEKKKEVFFRLAMVHKLQKRYNDSIEVFKYLLEDPPGILTKGDILFQIGHIYESQKEFKKAHDTYVEGTEADPNHHQLFFQIGYLYFRDDIEEYQGDEKCIDYIRKSVEIFKENGQAWYVLGRVYMRQKQFKKAFDSYQQAVFRDGKNPLFWCSIGALYYSINQQQDALDAYTKAIKLNNNISQAWYNLGTLYESCSQLDDAISAYRKAAELDPQDINTKNKLLKHNIHVAHLSPQQNVSSGDRAAILNSLFQKTGSNALLPQQNFPPSRITGVFPQFVGGKHGSFVNQNQFGINLQQFNNQQKALQQQAEDMLKQKNQIQQSNSGSMIKIEPGTAGDQQALSKSMRAADKQNAAVNMMNIQQQGKKNIVKGGASILGKRNRPITGQPIEPSSKRPKFSTVTQQMLIPNFQTQLNPNSSLLQNQVRGGMNLNLPQQFRYPQPNFALAQQNLKNLANAQMSKQILQNLKGMQKFQMNQQQLLQKQNQEQSQLAQQKMKKAGLFHPQKGMMKTGVHYPHLQLGNMLQHRNLLPTHQQSKINTSSANLYRKVSPNAPPTAAQLEHAKAIIERPQTGTKQGSGQNKISSAVPSKQKIQKLQEITATLQQKGKIGNMLASLAKTSPKSTVQQPNYSLVPPSIPNPVVGVAENVEVVEAKGTPQENEGKTT